MPASQGREGRGGRKGVPLKGVRLRAPVPRPGNIDCMAVNYMEDGTLKEKPAINAFHKAATAVIGDGDTMCCRMYLPHLRGRGRAGTVIGKRAKNVSQADAMKYIFATPASSTVGAWPAAAGNVFFQMKSRESSRRSGRAGDGRRDRQPAEARHRAQEQRRDDAEFNTDDMAHQTRAPSSG